MAGLRGLELANVILGKQVGHRRRATHARTYQHSQRSDCLAGLRGPSELRNTNGLRQGLGEDCPIDLQGVSGTTPKPSGTGDGSEAWPVMGRDAYFGLPAGVRRDRLPQAGPTGSEVARSRQWREVGLGAQILKDLGITSIRLLTSSKLTYIGLAGFGIEITSTELIDGSGFL